MSGFTVCVDCRMIQHSGIGTYLQSLLEPLSRYADIRLLCLGDRATLEAFGWAERVEIIECRAPIFSLREQFELPRKIPACDLFWSPQYNIPVWPIRAKKRVVTLHDVYHMAFYHTLSLPERLYASLMLRAAVRLSDAVITVSEFSAREIRRYLGIGSPKVHVIPNGVKRFEHISASPPTDRPYILLVGNIKPHKNLLNAFRAFASLADEFPETVLCCVGERENLRTSDTTLSEALEAIESRVFFTGRIDDAALAACYRDAQLLLFPSYYEGFGLPILEAMSFSLPIAASNAASIPEVGEEALLYFDPHDPEAIAEAVRRILSGRFSPPPGAYARIVEKYTWELSAQRHYHLFRDITA